MNKLYFMYHPTHGKKLFDASKQDSNALEKDGWVDNPGKIDGTLPGWNKPETAPEPDQSIPGIDDMVDDDPDSWPDEPAPVINTQVTQDKPQSPDGRTTKPVASVAELLAIFHAEPTRLTVEELVELGKAHNIDVRKNWKEDTLIAKLRQGLSNVNH